jgi:hypothetical protein
MSKRPETPVSRLICVGSAKACTNSPIGETFQEQDLVDYYD